MSTENNNSDQRFTRVEVPRVINLGGQSYSIADTPILKDLVDTVRKDASTVEKQKLYPKIETLKTQLETLANVEIVNPTNADDKPTELLDQEKLVQGIVEGLGKVIQPLIKSNQEQEVQKVRDYRNQVLMDNQGKIIPELVVGETVEEINTNLAKSKDLFAKYGKEFGQQTPQEQMAAQRATQQTPQTPQTPTPSTPTNPTQASPSGLPQAPATAPISDAIMPDIKAMTPEEFAKQREAIKKSLETMTN